MVDLERRLDAISERLRVVEVQLERSRADYQELLWQRFTPRSANGELPTRPRLEVG